MELLDIFNLTLLNSLPRLVTPILLAALGGMLCERAGVFNIALEGLLLIGAFFAVVGSFFTGMPLLGVVTAMLAGMAAGALFALLAITFKGDQIVLGIALNLAAAGLTVFLLRTLFDTRGTFQSPDLAGLQKLQSPAVASLPGVGNFLNQAVLGHSWIVYAALLLVVGMWYFLFRTASGLRLRGVGEKPEAAETLGVSVTRVQYIAVIVSGALCGLGGAQLSLGNVTLFVENMSAGRGWIAVAAVMLGQAHPYGVFGASVLFGLADSIGFRLQGFGLPLQLTSAIPYLVTLLSLFLIYARRRRKARVDEPVEPIKPTSAPAPAK